MRMAVEWIDDIYALILMPATTTADAIAAVGCKGIGTPTFSISWERK